MGVRALREADVAQLAAGLAELELMRRYRRDAQAIERDLTAALARGDGLLADDDDDGRGARGLAWFLPSGGLGIGGYLRLCAVVPGAGGGGRGARLLAAYEAEVARTQRHSLLLVSDFNLAAQRFYARHGYQQVGALPSLLLPDVAELLYWKRLR